MALQRQQGAESASKYLTMVHLAALLQGPTLVAVGFAITISELSAWIKRPAASVTSLGYGRSVLHSLNPHS